MEKLQSISSYSVFFYAFLLLLILVSMKAAFAYSAVESLPGFEGPLPFQLETGYVGVGDSEEVQLFYYFLKSERDPKDDPLILWLTGGPGCSALSGLVYEIGPLNFKMEQYNGTVPNLVLNPYSWTKASSIIFVDSPVGTGFSYATTSLGFQTSDIKQIVQANQFIRKWLIDHPEFSSNPVYVGGDSYSGLIVPGVVQEILNGNEQGSVPLVNISGYLLGNPMTDSASDGNFAIPFVHGMGLISDELYESLKRNCVGEYVMVDPGNVECSRDLSAYQKSTSLINTAHILEPFCGYASPTPHHIYNTRSLSIIPKGSFLDPEPAPTPKLGCRNYGYLLSRYWANHQGVREALHIREGSIGEWQRCNYGLAYTIEIYSSFEYHVNLSLKGVPALIYSGDHDAEVPFLGTQAWIRSLNYSIVDDWRPWLVQGQVAGYTRSYANQMTFATVKGGGHTAPEFKPREAYAMFQRWISGESL